MNIGEVVDQLSRLPRDWKVFIWSDSEEYFEGWAEVDSIINRSIYEDESGLINFLDEPVNSIEISSKKRDDLITKSELKGIHIKEEIMERLSHIAPRKEVKRWLNTKNVLLGDKKPIDCLNRNENLGRLDQMLAMIEEGIHS
jgi:uncharacterized protein (DUF2384 family)